MYYGLHGLHDDTNVAFSKRISYRKVLRRFKDHSTIILEYKMFKRSELHVAASGCIEALDGGAILGGRVTADAITWPVVEMVLVTHTSLVWQPNITLACDTNTGTRWRLPH